jgi:hypothetical protein
MKTTHLSKKKKKKDEKQLNLSAENIISGSQYKYKKKKNCLVPFEVIDLRIGFVKGL